MTAVGATDAALRAWLAGRPALFAYGLLGDATARLRCVGFDYIWAQQDWLRGMGVGMLPRSATGPEVWSDTASG